MLEAQRLLGAVQFFAGLGLGSASLARHVFDWTLTSISGFSSAFARVLERSLSAQSAARCGSAAKCFQHLLRASGLEHCQKCAGGTLYCGGLRAGSLEVCKAWRVGFHRGSPACTKRRWLAMGRGAAVGWPWA